MPPSRVSGVGRQSAAPHLIPHRSALVARRSICYLGAGPALRHAHARARRGRGGPRLPTPPRSHAKHCTAGQTAAAERRSAPILMHDAHSEEAQAKCTSMIRHKRVITDKTRLPEQFQRNMHACLAVCPSRARQRAALRRTKVLPLGGPLGPVTHQDSIGSLSLRARGPSPDAERVLPPRRGPDALGADDCPAADHLGTKLLRPSLVPMLGLFNAGLSIPQLGSPPSTPPRASCTPRTSRLFFVCSVLPSV